MGVDAGGAKEIEGQRGLGNEATPKMGWEGGVAAAQGGNEVVLEDVDGFFSGIGAMEIRWDKLENDVMLTHEPFESGWALVVEHLEYRLEAAVFQCVEEKQVGADKFGSASMVLLS